ncbi:GPI inositol-deacylase [Anopheles arabiensis]|uniref:GPI inositol-deacylase n=1 Tax=Anopheles arabiensis TaxID=7173 RepID=A0A182HY88_ANOAR|nr:GPI inositol-deacylase [Anopheles arabiensis]
MLFRLLIVLPVLAVALFLYGAIVSIGYIEENRCRMTYMFEHPQYTRLPVQGNERFPKYGLYAYSEGFVTQRVQQRLFTGAPVLFVPGSGGSYKQVRSLASVALRKGLDNNWQAHLDYFSVDLNEELSGVYGGYLQDQTEFLDLCIQEIVRLYGARGRATRLFIVGHSVGGKLAQAVVGARTSIGRHVAGIVTLSAPVDKPVALFDHYHYSFYDRIEQAWRTNRSLAGAANASPSHGLLPLDGILFVTIGGGIRDIIVHDGLTASRYADLHAMTHNIPNVWLSVDHLCAMWCLQFVLVMNRFLFSMIVPQGRGSWGFVEGKQHQLELATRFLAQPFRSDDDDDDDDDEGNNHKRLPAGSAKQPLIQHHPEQEDWIEDIRRSFTERHRAGIDRTRVQMIRLVPEKLAHRFVRIEVINSEQSNWLSGCAAVEVYGNSRMCQKATSLTNYTLPVPSSKFDRFGALLDLHELKRTNPRWTHVLVKIPRTTKPVQFSVDVFNPDERAINVTMPHWFDYRARTILQDASPDDSYYRISVSGMTHTYQTIALDLTAVACDGVRGTVVVKVHVPWAPGYDRYAFHEELNQTTVYIYPPIEKPPAGEPDVPIQLDVHLTPGCKYRIRYAQSLRVSMARIVQQHVVLVPAHLVALLLLAFKDQLTQTPAEDPAFVVGKLRSSLTKPGPLLMLLATGSLTAKFLALFKAIPPTETVVTPLAVSILVHLVALGVLVLATLALWGAIAFCANFAHKIILRLIALPIPVMSSTFLSCIHKFPLAIAVLLVAIALTACGGVSLLCAAAVYFVLLSKAYEDYLENFVFNTARKIAARLFGARERPHGEGGRAGRKRNRRRTANETGDELMVINFHLPLFLLVILLALLNVPSVITWAKNYHYANTLQPDPSLVPALAVLVCLAVLWQLNTPRNVCGYELLSALLVIGAFVSVLYCQVHVYRLNYLLALVFVAITVHQIIAPKRREVGEGGEQEEEADDGKEAVEGVEQAEHEEEETGDMKAN